MRIRGEQTGIGDGSKDTGATVCVSYTASGRFKRVLVAARYIISCQINPT